MNKVFIIAEAGVNHNGDLDLAKKLIDAASFAGADAVKFQTFNSKRLVSKFAQKAEYQKLSTDVNETQLEMLKKLELSKEGHYELLGYCRLKKIIFLSSPFDLESVDFLKELGLEVFKIPSGEITNLPFLRKIGSLKKTVILSTGMSNISEVEDALNVLVESGTDKKNISILHCNTEYPTPFTDVNLNAMKPIADTFKTAVGYSDHTIGISVSLAAVALGATIIEKHFTLDKEMEGPDHKASLNPQELNDLVSGIREIEQALGLSVKSPTPSESKNIKVARKSIVALRDILKGEVLSEENLTVKRPGTGISPMKWDSIIGMVASRNFEEDELIEI
jgi:N,N'-diacetyllegionaminate synthase